MPILQSSQRYDEILQNRISQTERMDMDGEFMKTVLVAIHEESVRHQRKLWNNSFITNYMKSACRKKFFRQALLIC